MVRLSMGAIKTPSKRTSNTAWQVEKLSNWVRGKVVPGHGVASGRAADSPYPEGSIALQMPHFKRLGLDLTHCYPGTVNIDLGELEFKAKSPRYQFRNLSWIEGFPAETFSFFDCVLLHQANKYQGFIYYPHPETKSQHFHPCNLLEVIVPAIPGLQYGDDVQLQYMPEQTLIAKPQ